MWKWFRRAPRLRLRREYPTVHETETAELAARRRQRPGARTEPGYVGLALSGGGIRSAAVCMGAMQALNAHGRFGAIDYLSTVSGGGYSGACLSASFSEKGGDAYPFGGDVKDSPVLAHIRNYSNYLLPRSHSGLRNGSEAAAILLRGFVANAICILAFLLPAVWITVKLAPGHAAGSAGVGARSAILPAASLSTHLPALAPLSLVGRAGAIARAAIEAIGNPALVAVALASTLTLWAMLRSLPQLDNATNDTRSGFLTGARGLLILLIAVLIVSLQPAMIDLCRTALGMTLPKVSLALLGTLGTFGAGVAGFASKIGGFLESTSRSTAKSMIMLRVATRVAIFVASLVLPFFLYLGYLVACVRVGDSNVSLWPPSSANAAFWGTMAASFAIMCCFRANGYSLNRFYRDRLSKAFLVNPGTDAPALPGQVATPAVASDAEGRGDLPPLDRLRLSDLARSRGPYPLINTALNLQGSAEANKRGRNADFFVFTPHWLGSAITGYVKTRDMERIDSRLDLGTAMAISGAAASANMGGNTIRMLSPTLSLLNIRLGYYLTNPRFIERSKSLLARFRTYFAKLQDRFFLFIEMFNLLNENRATVYLSDGGHIENLGIYELLRRKCALIVAIDSEADPDIGCGSLLKVERFARIDLGARIYLPWEAIRRQSLSVTAGLADHSSPCGHGPHSAIGTIEYADGTQGILLYVKSSLSGDERDYVIDYATRNPSFPHESTGDQFFSEEQFEMYRALGFHMVDGIFDEDEIGFDPAIFGSIQNVRARIDKELPRGPVFKSPGDRGFAPF